MRDFICKICGAGFQARRPLNNPRLYCDRACQDIACGKKNRTHGLTETAEYKIWGGMRHRCVNPKRPCYARYGARGIKVCERWNSFENFLADMGPKPMGGRYTIERIDNDGDYEPSNCRWATQAEQNRNRIKNYTAEEDQKLRDALSGGMNFTQAAIYVGKSRGSVTARAARLGLKSGHQVRKIVP